jgi:hypothetical protein
VAPPLPGAGSSPCKDGEKVAVNGVSILCGKAARRLAAEAASSAVVPGCKVMTPGGGAARWWRTGLVDLDLGPAGSIWACTGQAIHLVAAPGVDAVVRDGAAGEPLWRPTFSSVAAGTIQAQARPVRTCGAWCVPVVVSNRHPPVAVEDILQVVVPLPPSGSNLPSPPYHRSCYRPRDTGVSLRMPGRRPRKMDCTDGGGRCGGGDGRLFGP